MEIYRCSCYIFAIEDGKYLSSIDHRHMMAKEKKTIRELCVLDKRMYYFPEMKAENTKQYNSCTTRIVQQQSEYDEIRYHLN